MKKLLFAIVLLFFFCCKQSTENQQNNQDISTLKFMFYNVENLYDAVNDPKTQDEEFLPEGRFEWSEVRYKQKLKNLAAIISFQNPDILGLAEVENLQVLEDLNQLLKTKKYKILHYESHDMRGIDNALFYRDDLQLIDKQDITARLPSGGYAGPRGILKAIFSLKNEKLIVYVNHWPSRKGDKEQHRIAYAETLCKEIQNKNEASILVMGDFNDTPTNLSIKKMTEKSALFNPFYEQAMEQKGTAVFEQDWFLFDQILYRFTEKIEFVEAGIVNDDRLINKQKGKYEGFPLRTFVGNRYFIDGCSDHFPVYLALKVQ